MHTELTREIARYFIISLPEAVAVLLATFIVFQTSLKINFKKFIILSVSFSLLSFLTYEFMTDIMILKLVIQLFLFVLLLKYFLKLTRAYIIGFLIVFHLLVIIAEITGVFISIYWFNNTLYQTQNDPSVWVKTFIPGFIFIIILAYAVRPLGVKIKTTLRKMTFTYSFANFHLLLMAILVQFSLLIILLIVVVMNNKDAGRLYIVIITFLILLGLNIFILFKSISITERKMITQSQETISENVMGLINSIRSQRHDFINDIQIINSLLYENEFEELKEYLLKLNNEVTFYNDLLKLDQPIISALLNAKIAKAEIMGIKVGININANLSMLTMKSYDIAHILGNLMDNAFDAVSNNSEENRRLKLSVEENGPFLTFSITNPGTLVEEIRDNIFEPGFTTKDNNHSGLGLYISEQLAKKLHGKINLTSNERETTFSLVIPKE